ncbi:Phage tail assembly chaperone [Pseudomonas chlororaphis]|jgi:hypothetical protein|uniref:phage tail assembly chaperone n=1 Tax=Pseudomonas chlororaphis TaxID=587753 RepID=UPI0003FF0B6A|nr:phage tail assembly chaperone [Pseudomonas chlororaphis]AIC20573.1 hypothetical protein EY04_17165 [Pseudomonas chlororaphis]AZC51772.1 hypothetical protein C4K35_4197 [Pseudomonas chlororaphis subsp. piscium]AZD67569.1 hypothetical protein C4K17_3683 [Pseudomonas chlororaphis subsp. aurantiaca]KAA5842249.1 hypothetical protein F2A37_16405 [Pseudomonas chlororaphis]QIT23539.1 hypothetical protein HCN09_18005 [Pseudomonas chlororaphis subsp. aurantiaca]
MATFKIAQAATFKAGVMIPRVGADPLKVDFEFRHRDRVDLAALFDTWNEQRKEVQERFKGGEPSLSEVIAADIEQQTQQIKDLVVGWGFDDPFCDESIVELVKTCSGSAEAVVDAYQEAYKKARLGN